MSIVGMIEGPRTSSRRREIDRKRNAVYSAVLGAGDQDANAPLPRPAGFEAIWDAICKVGASGTPFTASDVTRSMPPRKSLARSVKSYIADLARSGFLRQQQQIQPSRGKALTVFQLAAEALEPASFPLTFSTRLPITVPRTHEGVWAAMRWFDKNRNGFTEQELTWHFSSEIDKRALGAYIAALLRGGYLFDGAADGTEYNPNAIVRYRVKRSQIEAPRLRADGSVLSSPHRQSHLWRAMKMCGYFTARDLAIAATMPEWPISEADAQRYCSDLADAGYLLTRPANQGPTVYRLRPKMNTGPAAPLLLRARFVWDPNLMQVVGNAIAVDEVRL